MSHIGNKIRMGFFATPEKQGELLKQVIEFTGDCSIFDPTCGEGKILKQLIEGQEYNISTYGVEIDNARAEIARELLDHCLNCPIESMVISNDAFPLIYLNPPYDFEMRGEDGAAERKEYKELVRSTRYLSNNGVMVYVIPSYRFSDKKIARYLSTHFENVGILRFSDEDYDDFKQCIFIGTKKDETFKKHNEKLYNFLCQMDSEEFVKSSVTPINELVGKHKWRVPNGSTTIKTFYTRLEDKITYIDDIKNSKAFKAFKERAKPKELRIGGDPIINIPQGQMALLLASGAINGCIGTGDRLHAVQGLEIVSKEEEKEEKVHDSGSVTTMTKIRTKRDVSVKVITPTGSIKKFV